MRVSTKKPARAPAFSGAREGPSVLVHEPAQGIDCGAAGQLLVQRDRLRLGPDTVVHDDVADLLCIASVESDAICIAEQALDPAIAGHEPRRLRDGFAVDASHRNTEPSVGDDPLGRLNVDLMQAIRSEVSEDD